MAAAAQNTLQEVFQRALKDANFWKALRENPEEAVKQAGFRLSAADLETLKDTLDKDQLEAQLGAFFQGFHNSGLTRWSGVWNGRWPKGGRWPPS